MTTCRRSRAPSDRLQRPFEHDLEGGELLVDVVLGLVAELAGGGLGVVDDGLRARRSLAHHLGALHHALGADPPCLDDVVGLATGLAEELLALLEQPPRVTQLLGECRDRLLEQLEELLRLTSTDADMGIDRPASTSSLRRRRMLSTSYAAWSLISFLRAPGPVPEPLGQPFRDRRGHHVGHVAPEPRDLAPKLDDRNEYCGLVEMKNVSIPDRRSFICAIWSS